jgi:hypothetical protein
MNHLKWKPLKKLCNEEKERMEVGDNIKTRQ